MQVSMPGARLPLTCLDFIAHTVSCPVESPADKAMLFSQSDKLPNCNRIQLIPPLRDDQIGARCYRSLAIFSPSSLARPASSIPRSAPARFVRSLFSAIPLLGEARAASESRPAARVADGARTALAICSPQLEPLMAHSCRRNPLPERAGLGVAGAVSGVGRFPSSFSCRDGPGARLPPQPGTASPIASAGAGQECEPYPRSARHHGAPPPGRHRRRARRRA